MGDETAAEWSAIGGIFRAARQAMGHQRYQLAAIMAAVEPGLDETRRRGELIDRLAHHGIVVTSSLDHPRTQPTDEDGDAPTPDNDATWDVLFARGQALNAQCANEQAIQVLQAAQYRARTGDERAVALAEEAYAHWRLAGDDYATTLLKSRQVPQVLDLDWRRVEARTGKVSPSALDRLSARGRWA